MLLHLHMFYFSSCNFGVFLFLSAEIQPKSEIESPVCSGLEHSMPYSQDVQRLQYENWTFSRFYLLSFIKLPIYVVFYPFPFLFRVFSATWNVGGISPHGGLNLDDFLQVHDQSDIYVLGYTS